MIEKDDVWEKRIAALFSFASHQFFYLISIGDFAPYFYLNLKSGQCGFETDDSFRQGELIIIEVKENPHKYDQDDILKALKEAFSIYMNKVSN